MQTAPLRWAGASPRRHSATRARSPAKARFLPRKKGRPSPGGPANCGRPGGAVVQKLYFAVKRTIVPGSGRIEALP